MDLPDVPLLSMLRERMNWLHQRQDVLSQNVANADTPGFVARDLKPLDFEQALSQSGNAATLVTTNTRHIAITPSHATKFDDQETPDQEASPNGNSVALEAEMVKVSDTQSQFQAAANLYAKTMSMMKMAIGQP
ncbi:MAG TPA: flagellar basal body rod protein FlgB [Rhizomicrobium sp.]|jgi:flagellar basal-body rod protein FlgB|nr:flagellar basal body rod protein FlgB [Rhizomicrobium sp.]